MFRALRTRAAMRRYGLTAPVMRAGFHDVETGDGPRSLGHSRFNPDWLDELGIPAGVIVELGAYDGGDSLRFKTAYPQARVVAADTDPERVDDIRAVLAGTGAEVRLFRLDDATTPDDTEPADLVRDENFETFCSHAGLSEIDFLHMDLSGATPEVLSGIGNIRPRLIFMDWCPKGFPDGSKTAEVDAMLTEMGYELIADLHQDRLYRNVG